MEVPSGVVDPKIPPSTEPQVAKPVVPTTTPEVGKPGPVIEPQEKMVPHGAFHEERERRKSSDAKIEQIKALYGDKIKFDDYGNVLPPDQGPPVQNVQTNDIARQVEEMWEKDPKQAVRAEIFMAINYYDQQSAQLDLQRDAARTRYPDFSKWESEVNGYIRRLPLQQRTQQGMIDMAYKYVKGDKIDQILQMERAELARKYAAGEMAQGLGPGTAPAFTPQAGVTVTDQERAVAQAMGMTIDEYVKNRK
jgi:hypothetical protein